MGSARQLVDDDREVILAREYSPFGELLSESGTGSSGYTFIGEQVGATTGLVFLRARHYDSAAGRFLSEDRWPVDADRPGGLNLYVYVQNRPTLCVDPSGYQAIVVRDAPSPWELDDTLLRATRVICLYFSSQPGRRLQELV
jgi:RHS repeat-associated protein